MFARLPLKRAPKIISYVLWAVAGFRLVFPFSIESVFSLLPFKAAPIPPNIAMQAVPRINSGVGLSVNRGAKDDTTLIALPANGVEASPAQVSPGQSIGADMAQLDYASDSTVIFHGYFGLFVYDLNARKLIRGVDLKPLGCNMTQGDNACEVLASADGDTVQLHPVSSKKMYVYSVSENTLKETDYVKMEKCFTDFVDIIDVVGAENAGTHSYHAARLGTNDYGFLRTTDWTVDTLTYIRNNNRVYQLFDSDGNQQVNVDGDIADESRSIEKRRQSQLIAYLSDLFTKAYAPYYGGLHYEMTDYEENADTPDSYSIVFLWTMYHKGNGLDVPSDLGKEQEANFSLQATTKLDDTGLLDLGTIEILADNSVSGPPNYVTPIADFFPEN